MEQTLAFLTLFLGLVAGPQDVELVVGPEVAYVELVLDGEVIAEIDEAPWRAECDFGPNPLPHRLEAVAYSQARVELARAEQWINVARPPAEAKLAFRSGEDGRYDAVNVVWNSLTASDPEAYRVFLDGRPLDLPRDLGLEALRQIELPEYDKDQLHFLRLELDFPDNVSALAEATFGGYYADEVRTELTALLVSSRRRLPELEELAGWVQSRGEPLPVVAAERGDAEVVLIRDTSILGHFAAMYRTEAQRLQYTRVQTGGRMRSITTLPRGTTANFLWPAPQRFSRDDGTVYQLFPRSGDLTPRDGGLFWFIARTRLPSYRSQRQQLTDAVAVAGMNSVARNRRRAVVLLLGHRPEDESAYRPEQVSAYLASLGVPLQVWTSHPNVAKKLGWNDVVRVGDLAEFRRAFVALRKLLDRQHILWVDGRHLPQDLVLTEKAKGVNRVR